MTTAEKEARLDRLVEAVAELLARAQARGWTVDRGHLSACALLWWNTRGRSAAIRAGHELLTGIRANLQAAA